MSLTATQTIESVLAIPAFVPVFVCPGYMVAWASNFRDFRRLSLAERLFWSLPLSLAVSAIGSVLIGKFVSLTAAVAVFVAIALLWIFILLREWRQVRRTGNACSIGWRPLGGTVFALAVTWIVVVILSLVDFQNGQKLFMSLTIFDHAPRVNWTESVLRTGVPPANPLYVFKHPAAMRYYYFWNVVCAAVARISRLPVRAIFMASCIWSGFCLASLIGLYLKHFLAVGQFLRSQFVRAICLLTVTGLGIFINLWNLLHKQTLVIEVWPVGQITSWSDSLLYDPHHVASLVCCMLGFLLAWLAAKENQRNQIATIALMAASFASAFGLSIYVAFAFFLVMLPWGAWQLIFEHAQRSVLYLAAGGVGSVVLLMPYLLELAHGLSQAANGASGIHGGSVFAFAIREMIPSEAVMSTKFFANLASSHPVAVRSSAKLLLLAPGYAVELGFYLAVLLIYLVPRWRGSTRLTPAQRSLIVIAVASVPLMSFVRSGVLDSNDFGWRTGLLFQFPMLVLGSELLISWSLVDRKESLPNARLSLPICTPQLLRAIASFALIFGTLTTVFQALILRFNIPLVQANLRKADNPDAGQIPHNAYISSIGYAKLDASIPRDAVVQYNPAFSDPYLNAPDLLGVNRQTAIAADKPWCGSELGGDPSGCRPMASAIDALYSGASAEQARATCHQYGIQYLIARIYDPAWNDKNSWVWTLRPVAAVEDFRALICK